MHSSYFYDPAAWQGFFIPVDHHNPYHGYEIIHINYQLMNFMNFIFFKISWLIIISIIQLNFKIGISIT
ncbi:hypothetical protein FEV15_21505 [Escherichia coli]|nr:hypothetical protein FEV15_21505 [Escherichia coli]